MIAAVVRSGMAAGRSQRMALAVAALWLGCRCESESAPGAVQGAAAADAGDVVWELPDWFPQPKVPEDNPMSALKVELGRRLFYDVRLSGNSTQSCSSCHQQELAFTDGRPRARGSTGEVHSRSTPPLFNLAYAQRLGWADPDAQSLEDLVKRPLHALDPVELGLPEDDEHLRRRLGAVPEYRNLFNRAFPSQPITLLNVRRALAAFLRTLFSGNSPFDRYLGGDTLALSEAARRGMKIFYSTRTQCFRCHGGLNLDRVAGDQEEPYHAFQNTGLSSISGERGGSIPLDLGLFDVTGQDEHIHKFRVPSLRNVAVTAPYMHNGSIPTLAEVLRHYEVGGRATVGAQSPMPQKSRLVAGFTLNPSERSDLLEFLESLTDSAALSDARWTNPW